MLGIDYEVIQYYQYENNQQLKKELKFHSIGSIEYIPNENWIKYVINLKKCICLRDLMYWIEKGLVLMTIGQILRLCQNLLHKVIELYQNNLEHFYLTSNRIWLILKNSKPLTINYEDIQYTIVFTGFQCPIFETQQNKQQASISIIDIMNTIIKGCQNMFNQFSSSQQLYQLIFPSLTKQKDINLAKDEIENQLKCYPRLSIYKNYSDQFQKQIDQRAMAVEMISNFFIGFLQRCKSHTCFQKEELILQIISLIVNCIKEKNIKVFEDIDLKKLCETQENYWKNEITKLLTDKIQNLIRKEFEQIKQHMRLEVSSEDEQMMIDQIHSELKKSYILKYFFNSIWVWTPQSQQCKEKFIQNLIPIQELITKERVKLWIKEKLLQFINELI